jgi:3-phosphoshikimate 1-carboxyvinyltransferase
MLGAIARGDTIIRNFLAGEDCLATMNCFKALGVEFEGPDGGDLLVRGVGLHGLKEPMAVLDAANSGTTMRLILGILSGQPFLSMLTGDRSLVGRPMARVTVPLAQMGASIMGRRDNTMAPLAIRGGCLKPIDYVSPVASAQVKSAVLLAGLYAGGQTTVTEPVKSRDHTERMLKYFGAAVETRGNTVVVQGGPTLQGAEIKVPGDISSAAFLMVAAALVPGSDLLIRNVGTNPTRDGIVEALRNMGADIVLLNTREESGEPVSDIRVRHSRLRGTVLAGSLIPRMIDEIPVLAVAACAAGGETVVRDAAELKVKESDRIAAIVGSLKKFGADIEELPDGFIIRPGGRLRGATVDPGKDHRMAMSMTVAGLVAEGETVIRDHQCENISFPGFYDVLNSIVKE